MAALLGASDPVRLSLATKSVTAAIAMLVAPRLGGDAALAAGFSVLTGIAGAVMGTLVLNRAGVRDPCARGLATGVAAHGIGTARLLATEPEAAAFAGLAMGLAALGVGVVLPLVAAWLGRGHG